MFDWFEKKEKKKVLVIVAAFMVVVFVSMIFSKIIFGEFNNQYRFLFVLAIASLVSFFVYFGKQIGEKPELGFLAVVLICGSLLSFAEPKSYISWDEGIHYKRAENIAIGTFGNFARPDKVKSSFTLSEQDQLNQQTDQDYSRVKSKKRGRFVLFTSYVDWAYAPTGIVLGLGELVHLPHHIVFILARWSNLLIYALLVFFAIKKLKSGKMLMATIALFPTAIFLAANYNYDSWVTGFTFLGLAYLFSELQQPEKKLTKREGLIMLGAFVLGLAPKAIYFLLMTPIFFLKPTKFSSKTQYKKFMLVSLLSMLFVLGSFLLPFLIDGPGKGDHRGGQLVNSTEQVKFILTEPVAYAKILVNFMQEYINPLNAGGMLTSFAYLGSIKGFLALLVLLGIVTLTDKNDYDKSIASWKIKSSIVLVYLLTVALVSTALYVSFTPVKNSTINGVQPRYLIPLTFPILYVLGSSRIKNPFNKNIYNGIIFISMAVIILQGIWELIIVKYY